jgi:hypothetical protein
LFVEQRERGESFWKCLGRLGFSRVESFGKGKEKYPSLSKERAENFSKSLGGEGRKDRKLKTEANEAKRGKEEEEG